MESYIIRSNINYHKADYGQCYYSYASGINVCEIYPFKTMTSFLSVVNKIGSGKKIKINNISLYNNDNGGIVSGVPKLIMAKATGIEGGYSVSPTKLNSENANVESGILCKIFSNSTQTNILKRIGFTPLHSSQIFYFDFRHIGGNKLANGRVYFGNTNSAATPIVLNYGEGISLKSIQNHYSENVKINITVRDQGNGGFGTVIYSIDTNVVKNYDIFSIHNNESGKTIEIISIDIDFKIPINANQGGASDTNQSCGVLSVCKICGTTENTGEIIVPIKMSSTNTLGDSGIETKEFARSTLLDQSGFGVSPLPAIHRISTQHNTEIGISGWERMTSISEIKSNKFTPIILNEGEGIGVFPEIVPVGGINDLIIEYSIEEVSAPAAGGETGYAYP